MISVAKLAVQASAFLLLPLYTRYLSRADYGLLELVLAYLGLLAPVLLLQTDSALFRILIDKRSCIDETRRTVSSVWVFGLAAIALTVAASLAVGIACGDQVLSTTGVVVASSMFLSMAQQTSRGLGEISAYVLSSVVSGSAVVVGNVLALVMLGAGPLGVLCATAIGYGLGTITVLIRTKFWKIFSLRSASWGETKDALRYSLPLVPNGISWWLIDAGGRAVLALFQGLGAVGIYGVASKFAMILSQVFGYFNLAWVESATLSIEDRDRAVFYSTVFNRCIQACCSAVVLLIGGMPIFFPFFVSPSFMDSAPLVPILLLSALFNAWVTLYSSIYLAMKNSRAVLFTTVIAAALSLLLCLLLVNSLGGYSIALASLVSWISVLLFRHFSLRAELRIVYSPRTWAVVLFTVTTALCGTVSALNGEVWPRLPSAVLALVFAVAVNYPLLRIIVRSREPETTRL